MEFWSTSSRGRYLFTNNGLTILGILIADGILLHKGPHPISTSVAVAFFPRICVLAILALGPTHPGTTWVFQCDGHLSLFPAPTVLVLSDFTGHLHVTINSNCQYDLIKTPRVFWVHFPRKYKLSKTTLKVSGTIPLLNKKGKKRKPVGSS